jgi:hypothetical protein
VGLSIFDEKVPLLAYVNIVNADGTNVKTLTTAQSAYTRFDTILVSNADTIAHVINLWADVASTRFLGSVNIPAGAGHLGVAPVDLIAALPLTNPGGLVITGAMGLGVHLDVAMVAPYTMHVVALGGTL